MLAQRHTGGALEASSSQSCHATQIFQKSALTPPCPPPPSPMLFGYILAGNGEQEDPTPLAEEAWGIQLVPN